MWLQIFPRRERTITEFVRDITQCIVLQIFIKQHFNFVNNLHKQSLKTVIM